MAPTTLGIKSKCQALNSKGLRDLLTSHLLTSTTQPRWPLSPSTSPNVRPLHLMLPGPLSLYRCSILISQALDEMSSLQRDIARLSNLKSPESRPLPQLSAFTFWDHVAVTLLVLKQKPHESRNCVCLIPHCIPGPPNSSYYLVDAKYLVNKWLNAFITNKLMNNL